MKIRRIQLICSRSR